ncbi:hypothetical protein KIN20_024747 [Parelaphostrongylus tenuis]|uniref:Uncharacterized protein n=1 Tax=Parelaphostrongylus tenuis TaxID=148309 RepID=A0AAD5MTZ9_PARTN|nr:hypothetical protein KIN20_024747 [Parelaphostrongylus tenuis]
MAAVSLRIAQSMTEKKKLRKSQWCTVFRGSGRANLWNWFCIAKNPPCLERISPDVTDDVNSMD